MNGWNILDYCIGAKSKGAWRQHAIYVKNKIAQKDELQKINRYYKPN